MAIRTELFARGTGRNVMPDSGKDCRITGVGGIRLWGRYSGVGLIIAAVALAADSTGATPKEPIKIIGVCGSPRKGKTTATALQVCLDAAKAVADNIEIELIELAGEDAAAFGSDFDGIPDTPAGVDDCRGFNNILKGLRDRGYSKQRLEKICLSNFLRVLKTVCG